MIKIIIPVDEDSLDGFSAILRMSLEPENRKDLDAAVERFKEDGSATISPEILGKEEASELLATVVYLALASNLPEE